MTAITTDDMCNILKKGKSSVNLDASASAPHSGSNGHHADTTGASHAQTHQSKTVSDRHRPARVSASSSSKDGSNHSSKYAVAPMDTKVEHTNPAMGTFALEATRAAQSGSKSPYGSVSRTKMQRHINALRRNNVTTEPLRPGVPIGPPSMMMGVTKNGAGASFFHRMMSFQQNPNGTPEDQDVIREFDHDVANAIVSLGGSFLGLPQDELVSSPGMRKLVARNIRWFQNTPDLVKLMGLMAAKKLNQWVERRHLVSRLMLEGRRRGEEENENIIVSRDPLMMPPPSVFDSTSCLVKREREEDEVATDTIATQQQQSNNTEEDTNDNNLCDSGSTTLMMMQVDGAVCDHTTEEKEVKDKKEEASVSSSPPPLKRMKVSLRIPSSSVALVKKNKATTKKKVVDDDHHHTTKEERKNDVVHGEKTPKKTSSTGHHTSRTRHRHHQDDDTKDTTNMDQHYDDLTIDHSC